MKRLGSPRANAKTEKARTLFGRVLRHRQPLGLPEIAQATRQTALQTFLQAALGQSAGTGSKCSCSYGQRD